MSTPDSIADFLAELRGRLQLPRELTERLIAEVEDHLIDASRASKDRGHSENEAVHLALARFGAPEEVAKCFNEEPGRKTTGIHEEAEMKSMPNGGLVFRASLYLATASTACFLLGLNAGLQAKTPAAQGAHRVWLEHASKSFQAVWFEIGFGTLVVASVLVGLAWRDWKEHPTRDSQ
jgi:hypothetical protein